MTLLILFLLIVSVWRDIVNANKTGTDKLRKLKEISATRWNSAHTVLRNIFEYWSNQNEVELSQNNYNVLEALHIIAYSEETDSSTAIEARDFPKGTLDF